jgi:hypothetical protein
MPHRLAKPKQDVIGFLNLHDEEQILERITSQDWSGLALKPTLDMGRGVMATRAMWHSPPYQPVLHSVAAPVP